LPVIAAVNGTVAGFSRSPSGASEAMARPRSRPPARRSRTRPCTAHRCRTSGRSSQH